MTPRRVSAFAEPRTLRESRRETHGEDHGSREALAVRLSAVAARSQRPNAARDPARMCRLPGPRHRVVGLDPQFALRSSRAVEAEPARTIEALPPDQHAAPIARGYVPEHLLAKPRAAILGVLPGGQDAGCSSKSRVDRPRADSRATEDTNASPGHAAVDPAYRARRPGLDDGKVKRPLKGRPSDLIRRSRRRGPRGRDGSNRQARKKPAHHRSHPGTVSLASRSGVLVTGTGGRASTRGSCLAFCIDVAGAPTHLTGPTKLGRRRHMRGIDFAA